MPSSTRSNKESQLIFSPDPTSLERTIRKEARSLSTDNNTFVSLDSAQPPSTQTLVPTTDSRSPLSIDNPNLPSTDTIHPTSIDIPSQTSIYTEPRDMVAPLILVRDNNGDLHDQEGHLRNAADHLGLQVEPSQELFTFVDCSQKNSGGIVRDLEVQIGNALVPVDFHVLDIKLNWNSSLLLGRAFLSTVGAVCNLQTNQLCLTLIDPNTHYDPIPVKKPQTIFRRINDPGIIAACHCGDETHTATSIDSCHQKSTDIPHDESVDSSPDDWENDYYNPTIDAYTRQNMHTDEYDEDLEEERAIEYRAILDEEDKLSHHSSWKRNAPSFDMTSLPSIDTQPQQRYEHHPESFAVETVTYTTGAEKLQDSFTDEELLNKQKRDDTDQFQAEASWERTRSSQSIDTRHPKSIDKPPQQSIHINNTTSIDNHPILKTTVSEKDKLDNQYLTPDEFADGAENLFMHQRSNREQETTKEFYDTAGGIENNFKQ
ncbi:hypothetical protein DY000_02015614 [Brassica cretica]|uniref:Reverse transcriptase domain-containing protein n=1 Tax=Brassica cretica TaxID=69181 RepID=A0ABQ7CXQ0_BRACR|nr:hypothetical protein DY000_02015614 [Brassica cretica]